jgi:hypothetical protein
MQSAGRNNSKHGASWLVVNLSAWHPISGRLKMIASYMGDKAKICMLVLMCSNWGQPACISESLSLHMSLVAVYNCGQLRESRLPRCRVGGFMTYVFVAGSSSRRAYALWACVCCDGGSTLLLRTRCVCPACFD